MHIPVRPLQTSELAGAPYIVGVVVGLAQIAVQALVADASTIRIWRRGCVQKLAPQFYHKFEAVQPTVVPGA